MLSLSRCLEVDAVLVEVGRWMLMFCRCWKVDANVLWMFK
jgi:hypothetical protein